MTYEKLQKLEETNKAYIIKTELEGTCQLWEVDNDLNCYVVLCDNTVITQKEDNQYGMYDAIFPITNN